MDNGRRSNCCETCTCTIDRILVCLQELADRVKLFQIMVMKQLLSGQTSMALRNCIPHMASLSESWTAYSRTEGQDAPSSAATSDAGAERPFRQCICQVDAMSEDIGQCRKRTCMSSIHNALPGLGP